MNTTNISLKRKIMRRVYMAFAVRVANHPITIRLGLLAVALLVFAKMVHVHKFFENLMSNSFSHAPQFIFNAIMRGEVLTLLSVGVMIFCALSIQWQVRKIFLPKFKLV